MAVQPVQPEEQTRLWEQVLLSVKSRLASHQAFETWFRPIVPREMSPQLVDLEVQPRPNHIEYARNKGLVF